MSRLSLLQVKAEMLAQRPLPDGYRLECDGATDSIVVHGPTLAFCVTKRAIEEGRHKTEWVVALDGLIDAEAAAQNAYTPLPFN